MLCMGFYLPCITCSAYLGHWCFNLTDVCRQQSKESDMLASANKMSITENTYGGEEDWYSGTDIYM